MKKLLALSLLGTVALTAACSTNAISVQNSLNARPVGVHLAEAVKKGALRTEITGNPFGVEESAWKDHVTMALHGAHFGPPINFSTEAEPNSITNARLVVQFQPPKSTSLRTICRTDKPLEPSLTDKQGRLKAIAALCVEDNPLDWAMLDGPMPASLDDVQLAQFTSTLAQSVIRPNLRTSDGCNNSNCD